MSYKIQTPDEVLAWAQRSGWMLLWARDDYATCAFLATGGSIVEFSFERNKVNVRSLLSYTCK